MVGKAVTVYGSDVESLDLLTRSRVRGNRDKVRTLEHGSDSEGDIAADRKYDDTNDFCT